MVRLWRKYGYFWCPCRSVWESSHVYCVAGTKKVYFKQRCRECRRARNPWRVEDLICSYCGLAPCACTKEDRKGRRRKRRNINVNRPHRADLCLKCQHGWLCRDAEEYSDGEESDYY